MRVFIAVNLGAEIKEELKQLQRRLDERIKGFRWIKPELLHITLKFIGEVDPAFVSALYSPLRELGDKKAPFEISFEGLGCFPNSHRPRVIWIGVHKGAEELVDLSMEINKVVTKLQSSFKKEKFVPHLTLGRRQKKESLLLDDVIFKEEWSCSTTLYVDSFHIMQSTLKPSGPLYTSLEKIML